MRLKDFLKRDHLCKKGQTRFLWAPDYGSLIKAKKGWYGTNDSRTELIGKVSNAEMAQPTVGPYKSAQEALDVYNRAMQKRSDKG